MRLVELVFIMLLTAGVSFASSPDLDEQLRQAASVVMRLNT